LYYTTESSETQVFEQKIRVSNNSDSSKSDRGLLYDFETLEWEGIAGNLGKIESFEEVLV